jgi:hypothetical protein
MLGGDSTAVRAFGFAKLLRAGHHLRHAELQACGPGARVEVLPRAVHHEALGPMRATVKTQYAESLLFLESALAEATIAHDPQTQTLEKFLIDISDEIEIQVTNVTLDELKDPPYRATVEFDRVYYAVGNRQEHARETCVAHLTFVIRDQVANAAVPINPLGLTVTYGRVDQAFK